MGNWRFEPKNRTVFGEVEVQLPTQCQTKTPMLTLRRGEWEIKLPSGFDESGLRRLLGVIEEASCF